MLIAHSRADHHLLHIQHHRNSCQILFLFFFFNIHLFTKNIVYVQHHHLSSDVYYLYVLSNSTPELANNANSPPPCSSIISLQYIQYHRIPFFWTNPIFILLFQYSPFHKKGWFPCGVASLLKFYFFIIFNVFSSYS
jgi:hypothetical protein